MAGIYVSMQAATDSKKCSVKASGSIMHPITQAEIASFGLSEPALCKGVGQNMGKEPDRAALNSDYDCGYLYKDYSWKPVRTVLTVRDAEVVEVTSEPTIIATQRLANWTKKPGTFKADTSQQVENTAESNWSSTNTVEFSQEINYSVKFLGAGAEGTTSMGFSQSFGKGGSHSKAVTVSASQGAEIELDPGESVVCRTSASRGVMRVRITYDASLEGMVAVDYSEGYQDHHYYCLDINVVRRGIDNDNPKEFTEEIEVGFFANASVRLEDDPDAEQKPELDKGKEEPEAKPEPEPEAKPEEEQPQEKAPEAPKSVKLACGANSCEKCQKCRDWQFSGSPETLSWVRNFLQWTDADWDRWRNEGVSQSFNKRDGAACTSIPSQDGGGEGSAKYLSYIFLIHACFCDEQPAENTEKPAEGTEGQQADPCKVQ